MTIADRVRERQKDLDRLCERHGVKTLDLFGSATRSDFDARTSDLDFIVEFKRLTPREHTNSFFGLLEDLEELFDRQIDLVEIGPIRNPYFRQEIEATRMPVYVAA